MVPRELMRVRQHHLRIRPLPHADGPNPQKRRRQPQRAKPRAQPNAAHPFQQPVHTQQCRQRGERQQQAPQKRLAHQRHRLQHDVVAGLVLRRHRQRAERQRRRQQHKRVQRRCLAKAIDPSFLHRIFLFIQGRPRIARQLVDISKLGLNRFLSTVCRASRVFCGGALY